MEKILRLWACTHTPNEANSMPNILICRDYIYCPKYLLLLHLASRTTTYYLVLLGVRYQISDGGVCLISPKYLLLLYLA